MDGISACGGLRVGLACTGRTKVHRAAVHSVVFCLWCRAVGPRRRESAALRQRQGHARHVRRKPCARTCCNAAHRPSCVVCCMFWRLCIVYRVSFILYFPVFALCCAPGTFALVCVARRLRLSAALHQDEGTSMCNSAPVLGHVCMPRARVAALAFGPASLRAAGRAACTLSCGRALRLHAGAGRCCDCGVSCAAAGLRSCGAAAASPPLPPLARC